MRCAGPENLSTGCRRIYEEMEMRKLELLRAIGTPSDALLVDYRVLHML